MIKINGENYKTYELKDISRIRYCGFVFVLINMKKKKMYLSSTDKFYQNPFSSVDWRSPVWRDRKEINNDSFKRVIIDIAENKTDLKRLEKYYLNKFNVYNSSSWYNDDINENSYEPFPESFIKDRSKKVEYKQEELDYADLSIKKIPIIKHPSRIKEEPGIVVYDLLNNKAESYDSIHAFVKSIDYKISPDFNLYSIYAWVRDLCLSENKTISRKSKYYKLLKQYKFMFEKDTFHDMREAITQ